MDGVSVNGDLERRLPGNLNASFGGVVGETLMIALADTAVSSGSACTSATVEPSYVLRALGVPDDLAHASLRFTLGRFTTEDDIDRAARRVVEVVERLRERNAA
jgi:cysteine desulfurase